MSSRLYPRWTPNFRRCAVGVAAGHMEMWPDCGCGTLTGAPHSAPRAPDFEAVPGPAVTVMSRDSRALFVISDERHPWPTVLAKTSRPSYA